MRLAVLVAAALAWMSGAVAARADAPCQYAKVAELPARFERNRVLIEVEINSHPAWFMVDTGAVATTLFSKAASELGVSIGTGVARFEGIGGENTAVSAQVGEIKLGSAALRNASMLAFMTRGVSRLEGKPVVGLLGENFLGAWDLEFDLAHNAMRLFKNVNCKGVGLAYWAETFGVTPLEGRTRSEDSPELYVNVNGHRALALLDSGAPVSAVVAATARAAGVPLKPFEPGKDAVGGIGAKKVESQVATLDTFAIGDETVNHPRLQVADLFRYNKRVEIGSHIATATMPNYGVVLGADFLRAHRVLIANSQNKLYFTYNGGTIFNVVGPLRGEQRPEDAAASEPPPPSPGTSAEPKPAPPPSAKPAG